MQKTDILMGIGVIAVVVMLIIPLPTFLLDFLLAISIMSGLLILMIVMFIRRTFDFSVFPSLLLITTVFRLALNVSSTRLILLEGAAFDGKIIRAFGEFVVGGNYVVGFIIFIILVAVQFIVITKGATRTAEVAARFTLDAMPGKQMSIDSDLSNGLITEDEAPDAARGDTEGGGFLRGHGWCLEVRAGRRQGRHRHYLHQYHRRVHHRHGDAGRVLRRGASRPTPC